MPLELLQDLFNNRRSHFDFDDEDGEDAEPSAGSPVVAPIFLPVAPPGSPSPSRGSFLPLTPTISSPTQSATRPFVSLQASPIPSQSRPSSPVSSASQPKDSDKNVVTNVSSEGSSSSSSSSSHGASMPVAAIVGTTLALVLFAVAAVFLYYRKRSRKQRERTKGWADVEDCSRVSPWVDYREKTIEEPRPTLASLKVRTSSPEANPFSPMPQFPVDISTDRGLPTPIVGAHRVFPSDNPEYAKVVSTFIPTLPDELSINTGERLRVLAEFDDGWAMCQNSRREKGMVPLECLGKAYAPSVFQGPGVREERKSSRISSLVASPYT